MGAVIGVVLAVVLGALWALVTVTRAGRLGHAAAHSLHGREALRDFAVESLDLQSVDEILVRAGHAASSIFGCQRVVGFVSGTREGQWDAVIPGGGDLPAVPAPLLGLFGWFKHNSSAAVEEDLAEPRFGAMRVPMAQLFASYQVDAVVPLVGHGAMVAAIGLRIGRRLTVGERTLLELFRVQTTAACANVRLHVEAAHVFSLAREADLASTVELTLVPPVLEGEVGKLTWAGHFHAAREAGSDFFGVYPMASGRVAMVIGDAVGAGLPGSMVSAVVKSCCDTIFDAKPTSIGPSALLGALNRALYRSSRPVNTSALVAIFDPEAMEVVYGNAGHPFPYQLTPGGKLSALAGSGPLLGDEVDARYRISKARASAGDLFLLYTDGLVHAVDPAGKPLTDRRLQRLLRNLGGGDPLLVRDHLLAAVDQHRAGGALPDDIALLVVRLG
jgi:hypothetical protein